MVFAKACLMGCLALASVCAQEEKVEGPDVAKLSEALGHMIGKNLLEMGVNIDIAQVIKGLQENNRGTPSPLSESECLAAITSAQEEAFQEKAKINLEKAEGFLKKNRQTKGVVSLEEGKLQYKIKTTGKGNAVEAHGTPVVKFTGSFIDGKVFASSKEEEDVCLDELIPGLKAGMIGMKEGEKRALYIHPDLGYGTAGMLPPNSLLCFEVEVVKASSNRGGSEPKISTSERGAGLHRTPKELSQEKSPNGDLR